MYQRGNPKKVVDLQLRWSDLVSYVIGSLINMKFGVLLCLFVERAPEAAE
jgi:hypothetical protein